MARGKALSVSDIVGRIRLSYPMLQAAAVDSVLRQMIISELVSQVEREGGAVVLPRHLRVHAVEPDRFRDYKNEISGLTAENISAVRAWIVEMGLDCGPANAPETASAMAA